MRADFGDKHLVRSGPFGHRLRLSLYVFGTLLAVCGWFVDSAASFPWVLRLIDHNYVAVAATMDALDKDEAATVPIGDPGAMLIENRWSPAPPKEYLDAATALGRSTGIFNIITGVHHYEMRIFTPRGFAPAYVSTDTVVRKWNADELSLRIIVLKALCFWGGTVLSCVMACLEFASKKADA